MSHDVSLIARDRLTQAFDSDGVYALQLEVNDACAQGCVYCYMNALPEARVVLSDKEIDAVLKDAAKLDVTAVEWLGGEPLDRPGIFGFMARASDLGMRNNIWTGGLALARPDILEQAVDAAKDGLISVHLSTLDRGLYERTHPGRSAGDIDTILAAVEGALARGYPAERMLNSVTYTGLQPPEDMVRTIDFFEQRYAIRTSLNVYHTYLRPGTPPGELARFVPDAKAVAYVHRRWAAQWGGEPLPMNCVDKRYCSATVAVLCDGTVSACATIREGPASIRDAGGLEAAVAEHRDELLLLPFKEPGNLPDGCARCVVADDCWGCRSRAYAAGLGIYGKDPRCFRSPKDRAGPVSTPDTDAKG